MASRIRKKTLFLKVHRRTAFMVELHVLPSSNNISEESSTHRKEKYSWFTEQYLNELVDSLHDVAFAKVLSGVAQTKKKLTDQQSSVLNLSGLNLQVTYCFKKKHAKDLFLVRSQAGAHQSLPYFPEKMVVTVGQQEKENIVQPPQAEPTLRGSMSPVHPGISSYFTKEAGPPVTDSTKKKQSTLKNIVRRAEKQEAGAKVTLLSGCSHSSTVTEDLSVLRAINDNNMACLPVQKKTDRKIETYENGPLEQESRTTLPDFEQKLTIVSSHGGSSHSELDDFREQENSSCAIVGDASPLELKSREGHETSVKELAFPKERCNRGVSVLGKETESKKQKHTTVCGIPKTKGKGNLKLKKRKMESEKIGSGCQSVDVDLSDFEFTRKTGAKRRRQNSTTEGQPATAEKLQDNCCLEELTEDTRTVKEQRGPGVKSTAPEGKRCVSSRNVARRTRGKDQVCNQNSTSTSEECSSETELGNKKRIKCLGRVSEEGEAETMDGDSNIQVRTAVREKEEIGRARKVTRKTRNKDQVRKENLTSTLEECSSETGLGNKRINSLGRVSEVDEAETTVGDSNIQVWTAARETEKIGRARKGSIVELSDDNCETSPQDSITIHDAVPDFSNVKKIEDLTAEHIDHIVWSKKKDLRDIFEGKKYCQRHEDYKKGGKLKGNLAFQVRFGVYSDDQQEVMMDALIAMFCYKHSKYLDYVTKVLLPETMVLIYMEIFSVTSDEVEELLIEESSANV